MNPEKQQDADGRRTPPPCSDPYAVVIGGVLCDPYRIARAYGIKDPVIFQALKKLLRLGRKHKDTAADVREAITSLERWESMNSEDQNVKGHARRPDGRTSSDGKGGSQ